MIRSQEAIDGVGVGELQGFRLLFECRLGEAWMIDGVRRDLGRGDIEHRVVEMPQSRGLQVWRSAVGWLDARKKDLDAQNARELAGVAWSQAEIERERRLHA